MDDLLYQLLQQDYFYKDANRTLELLETLGLYSAKNEDTRFEPDDYIPIEDKYKFKFPNCNNELINNQSMLYFWKIAKIIIDTHKTIERNSLDKLDYSIFAFLTKIYEPFHTDGFIHYFNIPSK